MSYIQISDLRQLQEEVERLKIDVRSLTGVVESNKVEADAAIEDVKKDVTRQSATIDVLSKLAPPQQNDGEKEKSNVKGLEFCKCILDIIITTS